jgi:hypothetical protein
VIVKPETVAGWHRAGFLLEWRWQFFSKNARRYNSSADPRYFGRRTMPEIGNARHL